MLMPQLSTTMCGYTSAGCCGACSALHGCVMILAGLMASENGLVTVISCQDCLIHGAMEANQEALAGGACQTLLVTHSCKHLQQAVQCAS